MPTTRGTATQASMAQLAETLDKFRDAFLADPEGFSTPLNSAVLIDSLTLLAAGVEALTEGYEQDIAALEAENTQLRARLLQTPAK